MRRVSAGCLFAAILAAALCQVGAEASETHDFRAVPCWFDYATALKTRCGWLLVPENRRRKGSQTISLPVVIFGARTEPADPAPLLFINGGPGDRSRIGDTREIAVWRTWVERWPPQQEVIVLGLRGTGLEKPSLDCRQFQGSWTYDAQENRASRSKRADELLVGQITACREQLLEQGFDLSAYNSRESAADIAALRQALKIESWNLYGISYGTRIALTVMRHHPQGLRAVILDSVHPPQAPFTLNQPRFFPEALSRLFDDCLKSEVCRSSYPDVEREFEALRSQLAREPLDLRITLRPGTRPVIIDLDHELFVAIVYESLYWWDLTEFLPVAIARASSGDLTFFEMLANRYFGNNSADGSLAVQLSYLCNEEVPAETPQARMAAVTEAGPFRHLVEKSLLPLLCPHWPAGEAGPIENTAVVSEVPTLLLAGSYDPITPPELARQAAESLVHSHFLEFRNVGHAVFSSHSCAEEVVAAFLERPGQRPDPGCLKEMPPPDFSPRANGPPLWFHPR